MLGLGVRGAALSTLLSFAVNMIIVVLIGLKVREVNRIKVIVVQEKTKKKIGKNVQMMKEIAWLILIV